MTSPTDVPVPAPTEAPAETPAEEAGGDGGLVLRRSLRTANAESWDVIGDGERVGVVTLHYGAESIEGILALPKEAEGDAVRGILAWVTELLMLDAAAGPGGVIHWVVSVGELEDFWRRSPGRRPSAAETDLHATRARVEQVLHGMFEQVGELPDGGFAVDVGSVRVFVHARLVETSVLVRVFAITNLGVPIDGDLPRNLLGINHTMALGRFSLDVEQRAVWFDHVLTADGIDDGTLARTVSVVGQTADRYDDEIKERYGGRTFREEGSPVEAVRTDAGMAGGYL